MHPMTDSERQTAMQTPAEGLAPWIAAGWAALIFLGAGSVLVDRFLPAADDAAMAATQTAEVANPASPAWPQTP